MSEIPKKNRDVNVKVRLTADERDYLEYRKNYIGARSLSAYIRYAAISKKITILDKDSLKKITIDIAGIRSSLNQIARRLNATNQFYGDDRKTLEEAQKELAEIWHSLNALISKPP